MLAVVFFMQPVGQLVATLVALVATYRFRDGIPRDAEATSCDVECIRAVDRIWRSIIGFGALPAVIALIFRLTVPETFRWTSLVAHNSTQASNDAKEYFLRDRDLEGADEPPEPFNRAIGVGSPNSIPQTGHSPRIPPSIGVSDADEQVGTSTARPPSPGVGSSTDPSSSRPHAGNDTHHLDTARSNNVDVRLGSDQDTAARRLGFSAGQRNSSENRHGHSRDNSHTEAFELQTHSPANTVSASPSIKPLPEPNPPITMPTASPIKRPPTIREAVRFFRRSGHWQVLAGTSLSWLLLDLPFYGLGFNSPRVIDKIWNAGSTEERRFVYKTLINNATQSLVVVSIGGIIGGLIMIATANRLNRKTIQLWGFGILAVLFVVIGSSFHYLVGHRLHGVIVPLYILCQVFFNFGSYSRTVNDYR